MQRTGQVPWPASVAAEYRRRGYWRGELLGELPGRWAQRHGERIAVVDGERSLTYAELAEACDAVASQFLALGLRGGANVLVQMPNRWEFVPVLLACARIGIAPVLALPSYREYELSHLAAAADAAAIVVPSTHRGFDHEGLAHRMADGGRRLVVVAGNPARPDSVALRTELKTPLGPIAEPPPAEDVALLLLSGGTTGGLPKMIARTHHDYEYNFRRSAELCGCDADTVYLVVLPVSHNFALGCPGILGVLSTGGTVVLLPSPEPLAVFEAIARHRVTTVAVVPAVAQRWLQAADPAGPDLSSLALIQVGGSRCPTEVASQLVDTFGCTVQQVYGMAEGLLSCTRLDDPLEVITSTQGRPISPGDEIRIIDGAGDPAARGELLTRGPYTPRGYFRGGEHNQRSFTPDGWYRTGDVVRRHASGNLVVEGRTKELINRAGEKVAALEVEDFAYLLPQVAAAAAVALPDPDTGERVCLCVVLRPGTRLALDELRTVFLDKGIAKFKLPEQLEVLEELPLTPVGKPDKKRLKDMIVEQAQEA